MQKHEPIETAWRSVNMGLSGLLRFRLFPESVEITRFKLTGPEAFRIPLEQVERADLVKRYRNKGVRVQLRLKEDEPIRLPVKDAILWRKVINELLNSPHKYGPEC